MEFVDSRWRIVAAITMACAAMLALYVGARHQRASSDHRTVSAGGGGSPRVERRRSDPPLVVDVAGAVRRPGVYELPAGARVRDAVRAAGGLRRSAQASSVNRAAELVDGQQVIVADAITTGEPAGSETAAALTAVSINAADVTALDTLQGIGPVTAQHIVDDRTRNGPFRSVDDLDRVPGIGAATIESLRPSVTL